MRRIVLSPRAARKLEKLLDYLQEEWSSKAKQAFIAKLDKSLELIKTYPKSNEESSFKKGLHRCVVTRQTTLYYKFSDTTIYIVGLFDTRMDPKKISSNLS